MAGCSLRLCIEAGLGPDCFRNYFPCHWPFKVSELKDSGFTAAELRDAGFTDVTLLARAGFSTSELEAAGFDRHEAAASAGFTARESFEASIAAAGAAGYDRPPVKAPPTLWPKGGPKGMRMQPGLPFFLKGKGKGPLGPMGMGPSMGPTLIHGGSDSLWGQFSPSSSQFPPPTKPPPPRPSWLDANSDHMFGDLLDSEGSGWCEPPFLASPSNLTLYFANVLQCCLASLEDPHIVTIPFQIDFLLVSFWVFLSVVWCVFPCFGSFAQLFVVLLKIRKGPKGSEGYRAIASMVT